MGYYLGQFYFDKRDLYILLAVLLLLLGRYFRYPLPYFDYQNLLFLTLLFLLAKGLMVSTHDAVVFVTFLASICLTLFVPLFQVILFLLLAFGILRLTKTI